MSLFKDQYINTLLIGYNADQRVLDMNPRYKRTVLYAFAVDLT